MGNIYLRTITTIHEAKKIWDIVSPHNTIDDEWEFRYAFVEPLNFPLKFVTAYEEGKPVALLPLQLNTRKGLLPSYTPQQGEFLEFFGGDDADDNAVLCKSGYEFLTPYLIKNTPYSSYLAPLAYSSELLSWLKPYTAKYVLPLDGYRNYEEYLNIAWGKSSRKKIRQQMRRLYNTHKIEVIENDYTDLPILFALNEQRFGGDSSFHHEYRQDIFKKLIDKFGVSMLTVVVDGEKAAVSYGIMFKNTYIGMNAGVDNKINDLGKLLVLLQIDKAIQKGALAYDAGKGSGTWKEEFKFMAIPQYKIITQTVSELEHSHHDHRSQPTLIPIYRPR